MRRTPTLAVIVGVTLALLCVQYFEGVVQLLPRAATIEVQQNAETIAHDVAHGFVNFYIEEDLGIYDMMRLCPFDPHNDKWILEYMADVAFANQVERHPWRVSDWRNASVIVVPLMLSHMASHKCGGTPVHEIVDVAAAHIARSPWYRATQGRSMLVVSNINKGVRCSAKYFSSNLSSSVFRNAINAHFERHQQGGRCPFRCYVAVPYPSLVSVHESVLQWEARQPPRPVPVEQELLFQGRVVNALRHDVVRLRPPAVAATDILLASIAKEPFTLPECLADDRHPVHGARQGCRMRSGANRTATREPFLRRMRASRFSLMLKGDSPSSQRLYDALALRIPSLIISDVLPLVGLPFPSFVNWSRLVHIVHERDAVKRMPIHVRAMRRRERELLATLERDNSMRNVLWEMRGSRVAVNTLLQAVRTCLPEHDLYAANQAARASMLSHETEMYHTVLTFRPPTPEIRRLTFHIGNRAPWHTEADVDAVLAKHRRDDD